MIEQNAKMVDECISCLQGGGTHLESAAIIKQRICEMSLEQFGQVVNKDIIFIKSSKTLEITLSFPCAD